MTSNLFVKNSTAFAFKLFIFFELWLNFLGGTKTDLKECNSCLHASISLALNATCSGVSVYFVLATR